MSVERELGELTTAVKVLVKEQEKTSDKLDKMATHQAVLIEAHRQNKRLSVFAITSAVSAFFTVIWSIITTGQAS